MITKILENDTIKSMILKPTMNLRWNLESVPYGNSGEVFRTVNKLQQMFIDLDTGQEIWQNVGGWQNER